MHTSAAAWPILTSYDQQHLARIALPLGGIGTGTVSLGGRGDLRDWEIVNRPAKGFTPQHTFFALMIRPDGSDPTVRLLEGPLDPNNYEGPLGSRARNHGLPRFRTCHFAAAYPFGQVFLSDPDLPVDVRIEAFNPLIPGDTDSSSIPAAILRFVITNHSTTHLSGSVCGSLENFIGTDGLLGASKQNLNQIRQATGLQGLFLSSAGVDPAAEQWGSMALSTTAAKASMRTSWARLSWGDSLLDFWDDFCSDGLLEDRDADGVDAPIASLAAPFELAAGAATSITFLITWHFPNRQSWSPNGQGAWLSNGACAFGPPTIGNYYTTLYHDAWEVAERTRANLDALEQHTLQFVRAFCLSDLPHVAKEAALFNLSTLRTQTCFRTPDGYFYGWEGIFDQHGSCFGSCTHVWNYEQATAFLFGDLARRMREVEFLYATRDDGHMSFRVGLPLEHATNWGLAAADGQMGCVMKLYREWQLSGDDAFLRSLWPRAKQALAFCWIPGGWDADQDGVMEGCQHNTMDVEYYGPNPQMGFWYLGALRAAEEMARYLADHTFADTCHDLFVRGSASLDRQIFNGEYFHHEIRPISDPALIAPGLRHADMGAHNLADPELQLGAGCLIDQLVGQYMAHICGLGYLGNRDHIRQSLASIRRYNFRDSLVGHFNHLRSFALHDESALLMASYPHGNRPTRPFPYFNEVMTGFEYTAAVHMIYEGLIEEGLHCIQAIRSRYDGLKRSPFNEAECGHHYARAMASWASILALTGFHYSAVDQKLSIAAVRQPTTWFWSNGAAWGTIEQHPHPQGIALSLQVMYGSLRIRTIEIGDVGQLNYDQAQQIEPNKALTEVVRSC
ncbi:MAG: non-lysosomal glucosylceramidase [Roseiflexaceae bacterium]